jgi:hypothetical protein
MNPSTRRLLTVFFSLCVLILLVDPLVPRHHAVFVWENWPGFYGAFGFVSYVVLVMTAKLVLRPLVIRPQEDEDEVTS